MTAQHNTKSDVHVDTTGEKQLDWENAKNSFLCLAIAIECPGATLASSIQGTTHTTPTESQE